MKTPVTLHTFYFDCWKRDGRINTKTIYAADKSDAEILFKGKYPDYAFDSPYGDWQKDAITTEDLKAESDAYYTK